MEGLWTVWFLTPDHDEMDLNGGVVVIETNRVLGGDSGYFYLGEVSARDAGRWSLKVKITRHDPGVISIFGDLDQFELVGVLAREANDESGRPTMIASLGDSEENQLMKARLTKVSDLP